MFRYLQWLRNSQRSEFEFHKTNKWRQQSQREWDELNKTFFSGDFALEDKAELTYLDVGAGSRMRLSFLTEASVMVVEPLADQFIASIPWCDLGKAAKVFSKPAENRIDELENSADVVVSVNVIDHVYDYKSVVRNMCHYVKPAGRLMLSFDEHKKTDEMHPVIITLDEIQNLIRSQSFETISMSQKAPFHPGLKGVRHDIVAKRRSGNLGERD